MSTFLSHSPSSQWCWIALASVGLAVGSVACAARQGEKIVTPHPVAEAYSLMDQGENAKAIVLLEGVLAQDASNREARVLLASAYLGQAGIDVYGLHGSFQDVIFAKPVGETLWQDPDAEKNKSPEGGALKAVSQAPQKAPLEKLIDRLEHFLNELRQKVSFLSRFPAAPKKNWPLFEESLKLLDQVGTEKDVSLYRVFIRVVYTKAYLHDEIIGDTTLGTRQWLCHLELQKFQEGLRWVLGHMVAALDDFSRVYPEKTSSLMGIHANCSALLAALEEAKEKDSALSGTDGLMLQEKLREKLRCADFQFAQGEP